MRYSSPVGAWVFAVTLLGAAVCCVLSLTGLMAPVAAGASLLPLFVVMGVGVAFPASGVFARPVLRGDSSRRNLALTFDDGPDPQWTPRILELLEARRQRATFFVIGERAERYPELLREIVRKGHEVANHTWSHSYLTVFVPPRSLAQQLERTNSVVSSATGTRPIWFRAPVGLLSPRVADASRLAGLRLVSWTAAARDGVGRTTVAAALARLQKGLVPGAIMVLHDGQMNRAREPITLAVVRMLLDQMDAEGLRSVTLSELCDASDGNDSAPVGGQGVSPVGSTSRL